MSAPEYAPLFPLRKRLRLAAKVFLPPILFCWLLIYLLKETEFFLCMPYGYTVLFYTLFCLLPLAAAIFSLFNCRSALDTIRTRRHPPLGQATLFRTRISHGLPALLIGWLMLLLPIFALAVAVHGGYTARQLSLRLNHSQIESDRKTHCSNYKYMLFMLSKYN